jgi:hypothetical protein
MNITELQFAFLARREMGETPTVAMANAFRDVTGEEYAEHQELCRLRLHMAGQAARARHIERAAAQRAAR